MQIDICAIGKVKEPYLRDGITEYLKRLSGFCTVKIVEFSEERVKENASVHEIESACQQEGKNLLKAAGQSGYLIAMDPAGISLSSEGFAGLVRRWEIDGPHHIAVLIGGPHGLSDEVRDQAGLLLSLSLMTFTHQMARFILLEQIYRAYTINRGLPYHR
ncbi:MAG TPA: 23S rRNA (pseudouridine(1915)-N(3))-methyltransferase RlmH [Methanospirillum sp.]|uniref:23S rRNA (pseudouridine(1915)-N(3))-methyltransferase RlmH n=1 Tax=Methanospirillum sp. TaxID=45200 RepID=UPI002D12E8A9|nr:23S rRNA (pseudouridine(1915)-N(3))-methyltransferase RlmH [Methanospirillum sp.]HWQ64268.1 23S rRNA (pseudouridine(1915)-N(3))-methyltransferase RlmH [Methanospirillum sp.]